jgi:hypothetical protein
VGITTSQVQYRQPSELLKGANGFATRGAPWKSPATTRCPSRSDSRAGAVACVANQHSRSVAGSRLLQAQRSSVGTVRLVTRSPADVPTRSYLGGMRWGLDQWGQSLNATVPFARLVLAAYGVTGGPSARFVPLVPTLEFRWEDLRLIEPVSWPFVPFIADGVRFLTADSGFIFWSGSGSRSNRILDVCEAASPGLVSRKTRRAPLNGLK